MLCGAVERSGKRVRLACNDQSADSGGAKLARHETSAPKGASPMPDIPGAFMVKQEQGGTALTCTDPTCPAQFSSILKLRKHLKSRHGIMRPFACDVPGCGQMLASRAVLVAHHRAHDGIKPFSCSYDGCDASFGQMSNLKRHELVHTGERPVRYCVVQ